MTICLRLSIKKEEIDMEMPTIEIVAHDAKSAYAD
jgi:hypothetical protein